MKTPLKVFYKGNQSVSTDLPLGSPSAAKPALLIKRWFESDKNVEFCDFRPVTKEDFYLVHDKKFVDGVLSCQEPNGFGTTHVEVAQALPWTTGSFYAAALHAYQNKVITCSPTSGFHHAEYGGPMGFCTFNGLMITAIKLRKQFPTIKIGILDCDHHYGNGTDDIIRKKGIEYISHYTFGGQEAGHYHWKGGPLADDWIKRLPEILMMFFAKADILLYQAGADPHKDDPVGGALSYEQLASRDEIVFDFTSQRKMPVVWNLAGGYQEPIEKVLKVHDATMEAAIKHLPHYFSASNLK